MNQIYRYLLRQPTQETLYYMVEMEELCYGTAARRPNQYIWEIEDRLPAKDMGLWDMLQGLRAEYFAAVKISDASIDAGKERNGTSTQETETGRTTPYWITSGECNFWEMKKEISNDC